MARKKCREKMSRKNWREKTGAKKMARKKWREKNGATSFSSTFSIDFQLAVESNRAEN
jgi:hypothetical protein